MTPTLASATTAPSTGIAGTCEARLWVEGHERPCQRTVALRTWYDGSGTQHRACSTHIAGRQHRYPPADAPWPGDLPVDEEVIDHPAEATVESEYATFWTAGTGTR